MANHRNTEEKFWRSVNREAPNGCWEWTGSLWASGYGRFVFDGKSDRSHRLSWRFVGKELKDDDCLLHKCDNRLCCNPDHLFIGTRAENNLDKTRKGRQSKGEDFERTRLTESDVLAIRASSASIAELAQQYGVAWCHINNIRHRRKWRHV